MYIIQCTYICGNMYFLCGIIMHYTFFKFGFKVHLLTRALHFAYRLIVKLYNLTT